MRPRYTIKLSVHDNQRFDSWQMAVDSDEFPVFSEQFVSDVRSPFAPLTLGSEPLAGLVKVLKKREFRRDLLLHAAKKLAQRLADYIEDKEGWHGEERRDTIKEQERSA